MKKNSRGQERVGYALKTKGNINGVITFEIYTRKKDAEKVAKNYKFEVVKVLITEI